LEIALEIELSRQVRNLSDQLNWLPMNGRFAPTAVVPEMWLLTLNGAVATAPTSYQAGIDHYDSIQPGNALGISTPHHGRLDAPSLALLRGPP
jgi:hypothetical protein